ncbi:MAG TPA: hypothetical protein VEP90_04685 [Methylomirabilota bacterium]|nr:hypothetical protein [Methylomirabilota bacterium]
MKRNEEITKLSEEILTDITNDLIPLHNILLKASRLSLLLDLPDNVTLFKDWAKHAERLQFIFSSFQANIEAAKDRDIYMSSANPAQFLVAPTGNIIERTAIRKSASEVAEYLATYRTETYNFALGIYQKWQFGNIAESIFEKKRRKVEPVLTKIFPDADQRLNSIELNINSTNPEDWKNAVASCRTLIMDIADVLNPAEKPEDKPKYINRLKDFVSPLIRSETKNKLVKSYFDEIKKRIEYISNLTQGSAHKERPILEEAENIVLYTYLLIADLMEIYQP